MMNDEQRLKRVADLLKRAAAKMAQAKRTRDPVRAAKLLAEAAELEHKAAKTRAGK